MEISENETAPVETDLIQTSWPKERVLRLLHEERFAYQRIELPYGLSTGGKDRSHTCEKIFPADMSGKSVLDVGYNHGYFCLEALKRGASRVLGVDVDPENVRKSKLLADCLGSAAEFALLDIDEQDLADQFDYVLCLNLLHHVKNPIAVLDKLISSTKERLVLEIADLGRHDGRKLRGLPVAGFLLSRFPVILVARQGAANPGEQKFFMTPKAVKNILLHQRPVFSKVTMTRSEFKHRSILIAEKRQIGKLIIVAGPTAVGKSHFIQRLRAGDFPEIARVLNAGDMSLWRLANPRRIKQTSEAKIERLIFHYCFLRPYQRSAKTHDRDEGLLILETAMEIKFVTLVASPRLLRERIDKSEIHCKTAKGVYEGTVRHRKLRKDYECPTRVRHFYETWFDFSRRWSDQHLLISYGERVRWAGIEGWESVAEANGLGYNADLNH